AKLAQSVQERARDSASRLGSGHLGGPVTRTQDPDPVDLAPRLRADDMGRGEDPDREAADERSPVHQSITSRVRSKSDAGLLAATCRILASAAIEGLEQLEAVSERGVGGHAGGARQRARPGPPPPRGPGAPAPTPQPPPRR